MDNLLKPMFPVETDSTYLDGHQLSKLFQYRWDFRLLSHLCWDYDRLDRVQILYRPLQLLWVDAYNIRIMSSYCHLTVFSLSIFNEVCWALSSRRLIFMTYLETYINSTLILRISFLSPQLQITSSSVPGF